MSLYRDMEEMWETEELLWTKQGGLCAFTGLPMTKDSTSPYRSCLDGDRLVCVWVRRAKAGLSDEAFQAVLDALPMRIPKWAVTKLDVMAVADLILAESMEAARDAGWRQATAIALYPEVIVYGAVKNLDDGSWVKAGVQIYRDGVKIVFSKSNRTINGPKHKNLGKETLSTIDDPQWVERLVATLPALFTKYEVLARDTQSDQSGPG